MRGDKPLNSCARSQPHGKAKTSLQCLFALCETGCWVKFIYYSNLARLLCSWVQELGQ